MKQPGVGWFGGQTAQATGEPTSAHIKEQIHRALLDQMNLREASNMAPERLRRECTRRVDELLATLRHPLSAVAKQRLVTELLDEIFGLGPLEELLRVPDISDILVNGASCVYIERKGVLERTNVRFRDDEHVIRIIQRIAARVGRRIDEGSPMLDARLEDGSRVNAIIPPLALDGPALSIRRFGVIPITAEQLVAEDSIAQEMLDFLQACVRCKMNILISGGTGSGKTTLLNVLSKWIPTGERLVTIEDAAELRLPREHVVRLETRPPNIEGKGQVTQRELLRNTLRMRPDRIIIGEVRGAEALDMLQAMNTGHEGSMTTVHANNPRDAFRRVENMVSMAGLNFPLVSIRQQMASALDISLHVDRVLGGKRKVVKIAEVTGTEGDVICLQDLFQFVQTGVGEGGHAQGYFEACGVLPQLLGRLKAYGAVLPPDMFRHRVLGTATAGQLGRSS